MIFRQLLSKKNSALPLRRIRLEKSQIIEIPNRLPPTKMTLCGIQFFHINLKVPSNNQSKKVIVSFSSQFYCNFLKTRPFFNFDFFLLLRSHYLVKMHFPTFFAGVGSTKFGKMKNFKVVKKNPPVFWWP